MSILALFCNIGNFFSGQGYLVFGLLADIYNIRGVDA